MTDSHVALVTGANTGIGAAVAQNLAASGHAVVVAFLAFENDPDPTMTETLRANHRRDGAEVVAAITAAGGRAIAISADLSDAATIPAVFEASEKHFGPVEVLINNATASLRDSFRGDGGVGQPGIGSRVTAENFDRQFAVDARAGALLIAEFASRLQARGGNWGRIVSLTSGGERGFPGEVSYGAAKAALVNYTMSASLELGSWGVTANAVHPPVTDTGWVNDDVRAWVESTDDFFDVADPSEVAEVIAFLVSHEGRRVTGNTIRMS
jgi:3-oxoacyl-[acyl-carrier protein] reductase